MTVFKKDGTTARLPRPQSGHRRRGLTLTELVMVLLILAALAGMVIPLIGSTREQADRALAASGSADLIQSIEGFRLATGDYPARLDSLLADDGTGTFVAYSKLWNELGATTAWFDPQDLNSSSASADYAESLALAGIDRVMDHDEAEPDPNDSGRFLRLLFTGATPDATVAVVTDEAVLKAAGLADLDADGLVSDEITDTDGDGNPDVKYVAFGIGVACEMVGETMASAPRHSAADLADYGRFLAVFAVYENGKPAELKTVLDSHRRPVSENYKRYRQAGSQAG